MRYSLFITGSLHPFCSRISLHSSLIYPQATGK